MTEDSPVLIEASSGELPEDQKVPSPDSPWVSDVTDESPIVAITVSNVDDVIMTSLSLPETANVEDITVSVYKKDTKTVSNIQQLRSYLILAFLTSDPLCSLQRQ